MSTFPRTSARRKAALLGLGGLGLIVLACTCGPLSQLQGLQATAGAAQGTLGAFATLVDENLPTLQAQLTEIGPTLEAQLTEVGPTLEAQLTQGAPTLDALQTAAGDLLPTLQAQLTTPGPGAAAEGEVRQWAAGAAASSQFGEAAWSAGQAIGAPNTPACGDQVTAWASASANGVDWLRLEYATPVTPTRIEIHQTYNPGAIVQVELTVAGGGVTHIVYEAAPAPGAECPFVLVIPVSGLDLKIAEIIIHLDQTGHPGFNQIDAVELIGIP